MKDVLTVWCALWGALAAVYFSAYGVCFILDRWKSIMNGPNKYAVIAWIVFAAVTAGGLGFALWGAFWGTMSAIAGAVLAHLAVVSDVADDSHLHGD